MSIPNSVLSMIHETHLGVAMISDVIGRTYFFYFCSHKVVVVRGLYNRRAWLELRDTDLNRIIGTSS